VKYVKPQWIRKCIQAGKLIPENDYLLIKDLTNHKIQQYCANRPLMEEKQIVARIYSQTHNKKADEPSNSDNN